MTVTANLHDGTQLEFPDGTPDSVIDSTVKSHLSPSNPIAHGLGVAGAAAIRGIPAVPLGIIDTTDRIIPWAANTFGNEQIPYPPSANAAYQNYVNKHLDLPTSINKPEDYLNAIGVGAAGGGAVAGIPGAVSGALAGVGSQIGQDLPLSHNNMTFMGKDLGVAPSDIASTILGMLGGGAASIKNYVAPRLAGTNEAALATKLMQSDPPVPVRLGDVQSAVDNAEQLRPITQNIANMVGIPSDEITPAYMGKAKGKIGAAMDTLAQNSYISPEKAGMLNDNLANALKNVSIDQNKSTVNNNFNNVLSNLDENGGLSGQDAFALHQRWGKLQRSAASTGNSDLADALGQGRSSLEDSLTSGMPEDLQPLWQETRGQYRNLKTLEGDVTKDPVSGLVNPKALAAGVAKIYPNYEYDDQNPLPQLTQAAQLVAPQGALSAGLHDVAPNIVNDYWNGAKSLISPFAKLTGADRYLNPLLSPSDFQISKYQNLVDALKGTAISQSLNQGDQ